MTSEPPEADEAAAECEEGFLDIGAAVVANKQPLDVVQTPSASPTPSLEASGVASRVAAVGATHERSGPLPVSTHRNCPDCGRSMDRGARTCPHCGVEFRPWLQHAGVWWTQNDAGVRQWLDENAKTWRWYSDGTPSSPSVSDRTPSLKIDPTLVSPPGTAAQTNAREGIDEQRVALQSPAPSAELERLGELHARGILTDEEFRQAKQRVLDG
jgi:hypothetical protein